VSDRFVTRFAPSPTGYLHLGHAFSALTAYEAAKAADGRFILRIEDIDATRSRTVFEHAIYEDLEWLGLSWEGPVRRQSEHMADYRDALEMLRSKGLVYRCFRTRREVLDEMARAPHGPSEVFRGGPLPAAEEAMRVAAGEAFAWRLSLDAASGRALYFDDHARGHIRAEPARLGDIVLARKDVGVAYHLAVVVDDALQGVNCVIRGEDLLEATHIQRLLQDLLGLSIPIYRHHRLLTGPDGKRYAKRDQAYTLREMREKGARPEAVRAQLLQT